MSVGRVADLKGSSKEAYELERYEIDAYKQRIDWSIYLLWINGIVFFGFFGAFAFIAALRETPLHKDIWLFAGSTIAGLAALVFLVRHLLRLQKRLGSKLIFDETKVEVSVDGHSFNFGMMECILWNQDYQTAEYEKDFQRKRIKLLIGYRTGSKYPDGELTVLVFDAWASAAQMKALQAAYWRAMLIIKSRRKFQREVVQKAGALKAKGDLAGIAGLVAKLHSSSIVEEMSIADSTDPQDHIVGIYSQTGDARYAAHFQTSSANGIVKSLSLLSGIWFWIIGILFTFMNLMFLSVFL